MSDRDDNIIEVDADFVRETAHALLIRSDRGEEIWLPKSQAAYDFPAGQVRLPQWLAEDRGLV